MLALTSILEAREEPRPSGDTCPQEKVMTKSAFAMWMLIIALAAPEARAQVTLDVAKITCDQFTGYKITNPENIAIWLSGYYNGKRNNTVLDTQKLKENTQKLTHYCITNPKVLVMHAVETVLGVEK